MIALDLDLAQNREAWLFSLAAIGPSELWGAANVVWAQLAPPADARASAMAAQVGAHGTIGKGAVLAVLGAFLAECEAAAAGITPYPGCDPDGPYRCETGGWPACLCGTHDAEWQAAVWPVIARFSAILNGDPVPAPRPTAKVLKGPW